MMRRIIAEVHVPIIEEQYDIFIPNNKSIKTVIKLFEKVINELSDGCYQIKPTTLLYNKDTGIPYDPLITVKDANIVNGTKLVLL